MTDIFDEFLNLYVQKKTLQAFRLILSKPDICYDDIQSNTMGIEKLINFVDAYCFGDMQSALHAANSLSLFIQHSPEHLRKYTLFLDVIGSEHTIMEALCNQNPEVISTFSDPCIKFLNSEIYNYLLSEEDITKTIDGISLQFKSIFAGLFKISQAWIAFKKKHLELDKYYRDYFNQMGRPFFFFSFKGNFDFPKLEKDKVPLLFLAPIDHDYTAFLNQLKDKPAIFAFPTYFELVQMLQFAGIQEAFADPQHLIYVMESAPNKQFFLQNTEQFQGKQFQPILNAPNKFIEEGLPAFTEALAANLAQNKSDFESNTELESWLYEVAQRIRYRYLQHRYGYKRVSAFSETEATKQWFDKRKLAPLPHRNLGPKPENYLRTRLQQLNPQSNKIKLAHVVTQICDGGHAPSILVESLISKRTKDRYDICLITTERLVFHPNDYPYNFHTSAPSRKRAPARLPNLFKENILYGEVSPQYNYEQGAQRVIETLNQFNPDVIVFHGPDIINTNAANKIRGALKVMFEHGSPPHQPVFDLAILSSESALETFKEKLEELKVEGVVLPFQVDKRKQWLPNAFAKKEFGYSEDSILITTISNHLSNRLSDQMIQAIAEILKRNPKAYYLPMGELHDKEKFKAKFAKYGVADRFRPMGPSSSPGQICRSMDLYLNEFPFGGCLSLLDAIASGCPVVSMYDKDGPQQARYAGDYLGLDRVVTSGKVEDYVELACKLLTDKEMYKEWREHTLKQYEKHSNIGEYVKSFERIIENALEKRGRRF